MTMTKRNWAACKAFVDGVKTGLGARGIEVSEAEPFDPKNREQSYAGEAVAMTKYGRLDIRIHPDWIHTRFDWPGEAGRAGLFVNPHSGKWNFHFHGEEFADNPRHVEDCVTSFLGSMDVVGAAGWEPVQSEVCLAEVLSRPNDHWKKRRAMGEDFVVTDLDREAAAKFLAESWTDANGEQPEWFVSSNEAYLARADDIDMAFYVKAWNERNPDAPFPTDADAVRTARI